MAGYTFNRVYWLLRMINKINKSLSQLPKKKKWLDIRLETKLGKWIQPYRTKDYEGNYENCMPMAG
jgi:hypothetical protein